MWNSLRQELHITDQANASGPRPRWTTSIADVQRSSRSKVNALYKEQLVQLQELKSIQETNKDKLRDVLPQMVQDGALNDLLGKLHEAQQKWVTMTNDYALTNYRCHPGAIVDG